MVDMANHDGSTTPHTAKGLEADGKSFVVVAATTIPKDSQVFLSYGNVSNMVLLRQWGFVLPSLASPPDAAIVDISHLITLDGAADVLAAAAEQGKLVREADGRTSRWQPAGPALRAAAADGLGAAALAATATAETGAEGEAPRGPEDDAGSRLYRALLARRLAQFSS